MAGIYVHIPFCKQACYYCNFHFSTWLKNKEEMMQALLEEIVLQQDFFCPDSDPVPGNDTIIETIYLGGGTPSLLDASEIKAILSEIKKYFMIAANCEITLEANPDDIDTEKLSDWRRSGINRLSIGVQSFFDEDLKWMNRVHDVRQALQCIREVREAGFNNFSADLIYGMPMLTDKRWEENIARMIALGVPHLSCYALTVEARTPLDNFIRNKKYLPVDEEQSARQFEILMEQLAAAGYEHYEISNFAKPDMRSKHNSHYWQGRPYLGIGPSAHSFTGNRRQWNVGNNALYMNSISQGKIPDEEEILTPVMQLDEYIMTSLRTMEGCNLNYVSEKWGEGQSQRLKAESKKFIGNEQMLLKNDYLILTNKGKLFADGIASELFR